MRGGSVFEFFDKDLFFEYEFEKIDPNSDFMFKKFGLRPFIFFFPNLQKKYMDKIWFRFAILNNEIFEKNKTISILGLKFYDLENNISNDKYLPIISEDPKIIRKYTKMAILNNILYDTKNDRLSLPLKIVGFLRCLKDDNQSFYDMHEEFLKQLKKLRTELHKNHRNSYKTIQKYLQYLIEATCNISDISTREYYQEIPDARIISNGIKENEQYRQYMRNRLPNEI